MKVKICGITDEASGMDAVRYGADAIGFVFAESKRRVTGEKAGKIASYLPPEIWRVGVFVNETREEIERVASIAGLTHIQLHGDEGPDFCASLSLPVIKAFSFQGHGSLAKLQSFSCDYILLDGPKGKYRGGNGDAFDWSQVNPQMLAGKQVILAGGLDANNVKKAISLIKPEMVDVSSGVEINGKKDPEKIKAFINKAKAIPLGRK